MSQPVLVRGFESGWWTYGGRAAVALLVIATAVLFIQKAPQPAFVCALGAAALALGVELTAYSGREQRRWLEEIPGGFRITDEAGVRTYRDADIVAIGVKDREVNREGLLQSVWRSLWLWIPQDPEPLDMCYCVRVDEADPLAAFRERIVNALQARCEALLAAGESVAGQGWRLGPKAIAVDGGTPLRFEELEAIDLCDGKVCAWKVGQEQPALAVPLESQNALLLALLLAPRLKKGRPEQAAGLGRVLQERGGSLSTMYSTGGTAVLTGVVGLLLLFVPKNFGAGVFLLMVSLGLGLLWFTFRASRLQVHERGFRHRWLSGEREVRYADVDSFSYQVVRHFVNGIYTGTDFGLRCRIKPDAGGGQVSFNAGAEFDLLRDLLAELIGKRMALELKAGRSAAWTESLTLHPDALEYQPRGYLARGPAARIPFAEIQGFSIEAGVFHLWRHGKEASVLQETIDKPNFFAGFWVLSELVCPPEPEKAPLRSGAP